MDSRQLCHQYSLDLDDVFDDDVTILANGKCRFIYANTTNSCRNCALRGQTCSPQKYIEGESKTVGNSHSEKKRNGYCEIERRSLRRNVRFSDSVEYSFGDGRGGYRTMPPAPLSPPAPDCDVNDNSRSTWPRYVRTRLRTCACTSRCTLYMYTYMCISSRNSTCTYDVHTCMSDHR